MKFLVDAQLPRGLSEWLRQCGHDSIHTLELPLQNLSTDETLIEVSISEQRVIITKDYDFLDSFILRRKPSKLLLVTTGNISNRQLLELFQRQNALIISLLAEHSVLELDQQGLTVHF